MKNSEKVKYRAYRSEVKEHGHERSLMVYSTKDLIEIKNENLLFSVSNLCLLPKTEYNILIKTSKQKLLAKAFYYSADTIYQMLYQQILTGYFNLTSKKGFDYKIIYKKYINREVDRLTCPIVEDVSQNYQCHKNITDVLKKCIEFAFKKKINTLDGVLYTNEVDSQKKFHRNKSKYGEDFFSTLIDILYYRACEFIRNDANRHINDGHLFFSELAIDTNKLTNTNSNKQETSFYGFYKLKYEAITVNNCYNCLVEEGFIVNKKNSFKVFKSIFNPSAKRFSQKIEWDKDIKTLVYFIKLLHQGFDGKESVCEKRPCIYEVANWFFAIDGQNIGVNKLQNNNREIKVQKQVIALKKAVSFLIIPNKKIN